MHTDEPLQTNTLMVTCGAGRKMCEAVSKVSKAEASAASKAASQAASTAGQKMREAVS